jgi:hypothetical protein
MVESVFSNLTHDRACLYLVVRAVGLGATLLTRLEPRVPAECDMTFQTAA